ncbi:hypothetical protein Tco_0002465 [Tanacetum coccineum]
MARIGRPLQCLTLVFSLLISSVPLHYLHLHRAIPSSVNTFLYGDIFWERIPFFLSGNSGDSDLSRLILEKTLVRSGLRDMLRERPDLRPLRCSPFTFGVLDSECCDTSLIFEFLPKHPSKAASDAGLLEFFTTCSFPLPTVFRTVDVGGLRISSAGSPMMIILENAVVYWVPRMAPTC